MQKYQAKIQKMDKIFVESYHFCQGIFKNYNQGRPSYESIQLKKFIIFFYSCRFDIKYIKSSNGDL